MTEATKIPSRFSPDYYSTTNYYNMAMYDKDGNFDWSGLTNLGGIIALEVIEAYSYRQIGGKITGSGWQAGAIKTLTALGVSSVTNILKEGAYHALITQHFTPNTYKNMAHQWQITYQNNDSDEARDVLSNSMHQAETATYQTGNIIKALIGGIVKIVSSVYCLFKGEYFVPAYMATYSLTLGFLGSKTNVVFQKNKNLGVDINNLSFKSKKDPGSLVEELYETMAILKESEIEMAYLKTISAILTSGHKNLFNYRGAVNIKMLRDKKPMEASEQDEFSMGLTEALSLAEWSGINFMRWIDIIHRIKALNKNLIKILEDREKFTSSDDSTNHEQNTNLFKIQKAKEKLVTLNKKLEMLAQEKATALETLKTVEDQAVELAPPDERDSSNMNGTLGKTPHDEL